VTVHHVQAFADATIGRWLPQFGDGYDPYRQGKARIAAPSHRDAFVYHRHAMSWFHDVDAIVPGTPTVVERLAPENLAGLSRVRVVYDATHGVAFFIDMCCSTIERVLTFAPAPPRLVAEASLTDVHTQRGIALTDTLAKVRRLDGPAPLRAIPGHPSLSMLSYAVMSQSATNPWCGQFQNFVFCNGHVVFIELLDEC
jgi:hypothetical protein